MRILTFLGFEVLSFFTFFHFLHLGERERERGSSAIFT